MAAAFLQKPQRLVVSASVFSFVNNEGHLDFQNHSFPLVNGLNWPTYICLNTMGSIPNTHTGTCRNTAKLMLSVRCFLFPAKHMKKWNLS